MILGWTKLAKNICLGDKNDNTTVMKDLLTWKTQWSDYMEEIIRVITINYDEETIPARIIMTQAT